MGLCSMDCGDTIPPSGHRHRRMLSGRALSANAFEPKYGRCQLRGSDVPRRGQSHCHPEWAKPEGSGEAPESWGLCGHRSLALLQPRLPGLPPPLQTPLCPIPFELARGPRNACVWRGEKSRDQRGAPAVSPRSNNETPGPWLPPREKTAWAFKAV